MELRLGPSDRSCTLSCIRESKHRSIMHVRPRLTITNSEPMLPANKKEVRINLPIPNLYFSQSAAAAAHASTLPISSRSYSRCTIYTVLPRAPVQVPVRRLYVGYTDSTVHLQQPASRVAANRSEPLGPRRQTLSLCSEGIRIFMN